MKKSLFGNIKRTQIGILVVDDEEIIRKSVLRLLNNYCKDKNIELLTIEANDGVEAILALYLAKKKNIIINFIISDETMNFMNGSFSSTIIEKLVSLNIIRDLSMYISTAYGNTVDKSKFSSSVKNIYSKPLELKMVKEMFSNIDV